MLLGYYDLDCTQEGLEPSTGQAERELSKFDWLEAENTQFHSKAIIAVTAEHRRTYQ